MKFLTISKFLLIIILPFILFLLVLNFVGFDNSFYYQKFLEYGVQKDIPEAAQLHEKVINFITGKSNEIPSEFNEREGQHLADVREIVRISTAIMYIFIILFVLLMIASVFVLKVNIYIINFVGKIFVFGGILTIILAAILFFFINSGFSSTFESFHMLFFKKNTYTFDPLKEIIVRLYPEQLFMDLGAKISKWVILGSAAVIITGIFLILKPKAKRIKTNKKPHSN
ncbi:DUF1461 domain-containing protein [Candidatus Woesearchaeota archaeon]|nr:DUF1461 domain-containing protein [Candidatus Woesearchaeota archaeon]